MDKELNEKIHAFIKSTYRSLEQPDFGFVKKASSSRPYEPLMKRLRDYAAVEQMTEADDEVCFVYLLKGRANIWKLDLSMVGPFGIFMRLSPKCRPEDCVHQQKDDINAYERKIVEMLRSGGIRLLTPEDLSAAVDLTLFNTPRAEVTLYQALFCDKPDTPWMTN